MVCILLKYSGHFSRNFLILSQTDFLLLYQDDSKVNLTDFKNYRTFKGIRCREL